MHKNAQKPADDPPAVGRGSVGRHAPKMHERAQPRKPPAIASEAAKGLICFFNPGGAQECTTMHN
jgi:hypothetical protein